VSIHPQDGHAFQPAALRELAYLVDEYGFHIVTDTAQCVRFESARVSVTVAFDLRGEIDLVVTELEREQEFGTLRLTGMVGRASAARVVQLLAGRLRAKTSALRGDRPYFQRLAEEQLERSEQWTAYYAGQVAPPIHRPASVSCGEEPSY